MPDRSVGIDLGASTIHVVVVAGTDDDLLTVTDARTFGATDLDAVVARVDAAREIAIDAPAELSTAPHRDDATISNKFRVARCGEIALGQQARIWVPWVTPADPGRVAPWMTVGFNLWRALRAAGPEPLEVYPAGVFTTLAGSRVPSKSTREGLAARIALLRAHVALPDTIEMWSHDGIDALAAAVTARQMGQGVARRIAHTASTCDGSAIWLPATPRDVTG
jgi:predicted nuclease with RNAse H fold